MSITAPSRVPAGWYPDPLSRTGSERRWWDGDKWTEYTAPVAVLSEVVETVVQSSTGPVMIHGSAATPTARESARIAESMPLHTIVTASSPTWDELPRVSAATVFSPDIVLSDVVPAEFQDAYVAPVARPRMADTFASRVNTSAVWLFALLPIMHAASLYYAITGLPEAAPLSSVLMLLALPFVLYAALAARDARALGDDGHLSTAPWGLALIAPPVYLAVRGVQVSRATGSAPWPLFSWVLVQAAVVGAWWFVSPETLAALPNLITVPSLLG
ncbi:MULTISPECIES: DUF2510 domain-containing protein [unclassified Microcella]|uniref:DUF2510 domain-containing protein n=1 Tax=unclassified Microcella TaxID=2630066 RepID=UPI0006F63116|nr:MULTISPECIES: DUF2510 domain-containing protein [unclassified Microcella]KQV24846.1 hypothetical protein ASC54_10125 [Yonghaparkia sp. Root332]KRF31130.1 hypothetical protein ASG83_09935 [Yonghaparkia sp. Soil809]